MGVPGVKTVSDRVVITGAAGQVGRFLATEAAGQEREVAAFASAEWDITDAAAARQIVRAGDVVVNCAAYTNVDGAESDPATAHAVNTLGPQILAAHCAAVGARLIHVSTDYVFGADLGRSGGGSAPHPYTPADRTGPVNVYGQTKLDGERAVLAALPTAWVVRTAWVYTGGTGTDFVAAMRRLAAGAGTVAMVDDQIGSPTYVADLVAALLEVVDRPETTAPVDPGGGPVDRILHAANRGAVSRYDQARAVFAGVGADPDRVHPVDSAHQPRPARRPSYSALASAGVTPLRDWREALTAALAARPLSSTP
ncbi:MAG TPA: dTDP-4-dehydrorhamnose reductase [Mycobacterium sp.]|nr:dTDP-4-dehydrorhamnose reductase [Mycobacterium sp.]